MLTPEEKSNIQQTLFDLFPKDFFFKSQSCFVNILRGFPPHLLSIDPEQDTCIRSFYICFRHSIAVVRQLDVNIFIVYSTVIRSRVYLSFIHVHGVVGWCYFTGLGDFRLGHIHKKISYKDYFFTVANCTCTQLITIFLIGLIMNSLS